MKRFLSLVISILMLMGAIALADTPSIPVVTLDGDCLVDYSNWNDKETYYPAKMTFTDGDESFTQDIEIKPQGTSSLFAPKKNFTVQLSEGVELEENWGVQTKYVLKADYIDPTHCGNVVSAKLAAQINQKYGLFADAPNYGAIDGFPVWVKINGEDAGIFNCTIPKDAWMFSMDEENPNHLVLACEGFSPACRMESAEIDYEADWTFEVGESTDESKAAFERMVEFVSTADDKTFVEEFDQYLNLDACLNYICFINTAFAGDNITKNLLMVTYNGKVWYPILYDLDSLWGIDPYGTGVIASDETNAYWKHGLMSDDNYLFKRVNQLFRDQLCERYWELREGVLSTENILASFEAYMAQIPQEYYAIDHARWNADGKFIRTVDLMRQMMEAYLPHVDAHFEAKAAPGGNAETLAAMDSAPEIHYVRGANSIAQPSEEIENLPVGMTLSYMLDGNAVSVQDLAGKSGKLEAALRVERKAEAEHIYGVAALVHMEEAQCKNVTVTGGTFTGTAQEYVCMGSAWLGGTNNAYEMRLSMDVTDFDPVEYMVVVSPVYIDGDGDDDSLQALLATAGELTTIINEGILLHESMVEWHGYLTNMQNSLAEMDSLVQSLLPSGEEDGREDASSMMQTLIADAEAEADAMLTAFGYELAADAVSADRMQMLAEAAAGAERTETQKAQASKQLALLEKYLAVAGELEETQQVMSRADESLSMITENLPDLVGAYGYANDTLYSILYKISTLYQNLANYYHAYHGGGDVSDFTEFGDWHNVIIFTNRERIAAP